MFRQFANTAQTESKLTNNIHSHLRCSSQMNFRSTLIKTSPIHCYDHRSRSPTFKLKKTCNLAKSPRLTLTTQKMVDAKQACSFVKLRSRPALYTSNPRWRTANDFQDKKKSCIFGFDFEVFRMSLHLLQSGVLKLI